MVFKVSKGGVRTGNTLRGLHSTRTRRYGHHACLLGCTSLGRRDLSRLIQDDSNEEEWVMDTLGKTDVLLSLNKQQRWRLPAIVGQMIRNGRFHKGATVSMLEKHKLKRKANCVRLVSNSVNVSSIAPKQKRYFSYSVDAVTHDQSNRERRRELVKSMKEASKSNPKERVPKWRRGYKTIEAFTSEGQSRRNPVFSPLVNSDKPEYRLEVFYPCPKSCSLTYNPKYTDVVVAEGKTGQMEVKSKVKSQKKGTTTHRKRLTSRDIELQLCDGFRDDVDEMWDESDDDIIESEERHMLGRPQSRSTEHSLDMLLAQAEKTRDLCTAKKEHNTDNKRKRFRKVSSHPCENLDRSHIVYMERDPQKDETIVGEQANDTEGSALNIIEDFGAPGLAYFPVVLSTREVSPEQLKRHYGSMYTEASCQPRRFVLDVTDDVSNLLVTSKTSVREFDFTSYLVFTYDGFYDEGLAAYRVSLNSMLGNDMKGLCQVVPFAQQSIADLVNTVVCHVLDLKEQSQLDLVARSKPKLHSDNDLLRRGIKLRVEVFDPSEPEMPRGAVSDHHGDNEGPATTDAHKWQDELFEDSFCDVCYANVTSSKLDSAHATRLNSCGHFVCDDCWRCHFRTCIKQGKTEMSCAGYDCQSTVGLATLVSILKVSEIALILQRQVEERLETMDNAKWCPHPQCGRAIVVDSKWKDLCVDVLCECGNQFCFSCLGPPHWPAKCEQAEEYLDILPTLKPAKEYVEEETKTVPPPQPVKKKQSTTMEVEGRLCPRCNRFIEKNGGCQYMSCKCQFAMCWNCMQAFHNYSICVPNVTYVNSLTRVLIVRHAKAEKLVHIEEQEAPKIEKNKQKMSLYQRASQQREEGTTYETHIKPLVSKMHRKAHEDTTFLMEILNTFAISPSEDLAQNMEAVSREVANLLTASVRMKRELHRVVEYTYILIQDIPHSVAKQRILKLAMDLTGYCSFVRSIIDLGDKQDVKAAFRRLVDLQGWAKRALDALIQATRKFRHD